MCRDRGRSREESDDDVDSIGEHVSQILVLTKILKPWSLLGAYDEDDEDEGDPPHRVSSMARTSLEDSNLAMASRIEHLEERLEFWRRRYSHLLHAEVRDCHEELSFMQNSYHSGFDPLYKRARYQ